ncbi:uncharacterized protein LAESUDRAFT_732947 [Laetiporus sulphureus 93-53]|uniref:Uncharacterized protein n=1 Tax=Laetiporus sulphureus 93-53 TaxID=1314785 RepID=A0A165AV24_9APHY|nr:uncharacterized protein LAESUDRAFT_732947 [Laetiporus sulphureus 93-53]KZS99717.1 hypothetical protein LAESUDRAFT_732947 [Laetiporus sulphureus 93-53]
MLPAPLPPPTDQRRTLPSSSSDVPTANAAAGRAEERTDVSPCAAPGPLGRPTACYRRSEQSSAGTGKT